MEDQAKKPLVCVIIHLDDFQQYTQCAGAQFTGKVEAGRNYFKQMVKTILEFMKSVSQTELGGEYFVLPICTGTCAIDVNFLPTESKRITVPLTPLTPASIDKLALEVKGQSFANHLTDPLWRLAVGDSMGIPRFVEWMLTAQPGGWAETLFHHLYSYDSLRDLANYAGPEGAQLLLSLALVRKPVERTESLGTSIGTIGEIERQGAIYLVPLNPGISDDYFVGIPFPLFHILCKRLEELRLTPSPFLNLQC